MLETVALVGFFTFVFIGLFAWYRSIQRNVAELRAIRAARDAEEAAALKAASALAALPRTCKNCKHFDHELGQKEMARQPVFAAAAAHIPPWRMGRVMKTDENGKHLPLAAQGVEKHVMKTEWSDFGACVERETLISQHDTCEQFTRRGDLIAPSSLVRQPVQA